MYPFIHHHKFLHTNIHTDIRLQFSGRYSFVNIVAAGERLYGNGDGMEWHGMNVK